MYRQMIIERNKNPEFKGCLDEPDIAHGDVNVSCGDELTIYVKLDANKRIVKATHMGTGCTISQVSADLLCEAIEGMTLDEVKELDKDFILSLLGIKITHTRMKCAILSLKVLQAGTNLFLEFGKEAATGDIGKYECPDKGKSEGEDVKQEQDTNTNGEE